MLKFFVAYAATCLFVLCAFAVPAADSLATITTAKNSYQFVYNAKEKQVEVKRQLHTTYTSNGYQVTLPIAEVYNDKVSIDDIECKIDNRTLKDLKPEDSYYSVNDVFYSDARMRYFPLYLPKKGSTASVLFKETVKDVRYFTSIYFSDEMDVFIKEVVISVPRWMKVEFKELNFGSHSIKKSTAYDSTTDTDIITYTMQNLPAMHHEDNSPGPSYIYPHLLVLCKAATPGGQSFTYFNTLEDQYAWYRTLVNDLQNNQEAIAAKAKSLTAGLTTDIDKIKTIFYYVQKNIRYVAFEDGLAGFKPEKADEVLRKKYGDCKGMANLTKSLLTALGYDARLCWLGTNHIAYDYQTPSLSVDNHMICGLNFGGKTIYLDATEPYIGLNEYAERIQGRQVLMENGDKYILSRIPSAALTQNYDFENSKLNINGTTLAGTVSHVWKGEDKESILSGLNSVKKETTNDAMIRFLSADDSNYAITDLKISSMDDADKDLTAGYAVAHKNAVSSFSKAYYIDLDRKKELINSTMKNDERKHDYWFGHKINIHKETELAIPDGYKAFSIPEKLDIVNPDYEFHISYTVSPGKLTYKKTISIKNARLNTAKFAQWNTDIALLAKTYNESVILKPTN